MLLYYLSLIDDESDKEKLERFYNQYRATLLHKAFLILRDQGLAEDAVHEAFIRIAKNIHRIHEDGHQTKAFLVTIVRNTSIDIYKAYNADAHISLDDMVFDIADEYDMDEKINEAELVDIVNNLPPNYSSVFLLKYKHGYSDKDIARLAKITEANVRKRIQRAKEMLNTYLSEKGDERYVKEK